MHSSSSGFVQRRRTSPRNDIPMNNPIPIPSPEQDWTVPWEALQAHEWVQAWKGCPQNPKYHGEGDVWIHTEMVLRELAADPDWRQLSPGDREIVYLAALFHDVGKPSTTKTEDDGRITSRGHSRRGAIETRRILWEMGCPFAMREAICALVRYHQAPFFLTDEDAPLARIARISQSARCDLLRLVARADIRGRICDDIPGILQSIELFRLFALDHGCLDSPLEFASAHARFRYFRGGTWTVDNEAYDDTRCEVILMAGLPGAGKNRWIADNVPQWPRVSLDAIRRQLGIRPTDDQGRVRQMALEQAREHLRRSRSFVWNATNLHRQRRAQLIQLFDEYRARVRIVYVEAPIERLFAQNDDRENTVPRKAIRNMMRMWQVPDLGEAHRVDHVVVESVRWRNATANG